MNKATQTDPVTIADIDDQENEHLQALLVAQRASNKALQKE